MGGEFRCPVSILLVSDCLTGGAHIGTMPCQLQVRDWEIDTL